MQPMRRLFYLCQNSKCQHHIKIITNPSRFISLTSNARSRQSALFTKREAKVQQTNIPVELDLDIGKRLNEKNQLIVELAARNVHHIDVHDLVRTCG